METLPLKNIVPDPNQPRQEFSPDRMKQLVASIDTEGILSPLMVEKIEGQKDKYLIVDGERRYKAAVTLGLQTVPVFICDSMTDQERMVRRFHVQEQHQSWSPFDKARAIYFFKNRIGLSINDTANILGLSKDSVYNWIGILNLSKRNQTYSIDKRIGFSYLNKIVRISQALSDEEEIALTPDKIQRIILEKLEHNAIYDQTDMTELLKFSRLVGHAKNKMSFLTNPNMTVRQLLNITPEGQSILLDRTIYMTNQLINRLKKQDRIKKYLSKKQIAVLEELKEQLDIFTS